MTSSGDDKDAYNVARIAFSAQAKRVAEAIAAADPSAPTACAGWSVSHLNRHLGAIVANLVTLLRDARTIAAPAGLSAWAEAVSALAPVADQAARAPGSGLADALPQVEQALDVADPGASVRQLTGSHTVCDALTIRVLELVVHGLDLPNPVEPDWHALQLSVRRFGEILESRATSQSATLEVRPVAVFTCRSAVDADNTHPRTAMTDPITFLQVVTGRVDWSQALAAGRVRCPNGNVDLSGVLPLLR